jgi:DNA-binding NarL/FixJ family response regulator
LSITIISDDKLWVDSLHISLSVFGESAIKTFIAFNDELESYLCQASKHNILLVDSAIPGVDYWSLVGWLGRSFSGKTIIFVEARSFNLQSSQLIRHGCHAVINKTQGFLMCWAAIKAFRKGEKYFTGKQGSSFDKLNQAETKLAADLLHSDVKALTTDYKVSQQAINKRKLKLYKKLDIGVVDQELAFKLLTSLHSLEERD